MESPPTISLPPRFMRDNPSDPTHPCFESVAGYNIAELCGQTKPVPLIYANSHSGPVVIINANADDPGVGGLMVDPRTMNTLDGPLGECARQLQLTPRRLMEIISACAPIAS